MCAGTLIQILHYKRAPAAWDIKDHKDDVQNELFKLRDVTVYGAQMLLPANIE